jgi:hypothetical protein
MHIAYSLNLAALVIAATWIAGTDLVPIRADEPAKPLLEESSAVDDAMFVDTVVRGRVTQRFEIYNPHSAEQLQAIKEMGFTQVILDWPQLHATATELGLDVVLANWWTLLSDDQSIQRGIDNAERVDRRRLVAVSMMDEPERNSPDTPFTYYQVLYEELRTHFDRTLPDVKLEISHWGPLRSWTAQRYQTFTTLYQSTDRIRLMPFPDLYEDPLSEVYYQIMRSRRLMQMAGRDLPQIVILQTWVLPENPKLPTIPELRVMAYQAMVTGADTISFFNYDPAVWQKTPGFTEQFASLMHELTSFSQQYREASVETRMSDDGVLTATLLLPGRSPMFAVINTNRHEVLGLEPLQIVLPTVQQSFAGTAPYCEPRRGHVLRRIANRFR